MEDIKLHNSRDWMTNAFVVQGKEVGEISKELRISVKLVILKLKEFGLM